MAILPHLSGTLQGLEPRFTRGPVGQGNTVEVGYDLLIDTDVLDLADYMGRGVVLRYSGAMHCWSCERSIRKAYGRAYCYDCFVSLARTDLCFVSPDRCHFTAGTCREPEWGAKVCMQPHTVYLANTSGPKIGITRKGRELRRWADQGAAMAMAIAQAPSRRAAGAMEAYFKGQLSDRTDWRKLVAGAGMPGNLSQLRDGLFEQRHEISSNDPSRIPVDEIDGLQWVEEPVVTEFRYPVQMYSPAERLVLGVEQGVIKGNLCGAIGQFLLLSGGVFNVADHRAMDVEIELTEPFTGNAVSGSQQMSLFS